MTMTFTPTGKLNRRICLERPKNPPTVSATGERVKEYIMYATVWAAFRTLSGGERLAAEQVAAMLTHEIAIRYLSDVRPDHRILLGTRVFDIKDVRDLDEAHVELRMRCTEVVT